MNGHIISVAVPRPLDGLFTYLLPERFVSGAVVGAWVRVPFGRTTTHAYVVEAPKPFAELQAGLDPSRLKEVIECGAGAFIPPDVMALCRWASDYYKAPVGEVINCAAPASVIGLRSGRKSPRQTLVRGDPAGIEKRAAVVLTPAQSECVSAIDEARKAALSGGSGPRAALLHGVTGSGKTEVYIELARRALSEGRGVIVLVPEIALTPQLEERIESGLGRRVALWHSALPDAARRDLYAAVHSGAIKVVVGARSAVFAPVRDLGLVVVDEEHDPSYKQDERARYNARDLAVVRAGLSGAFTVLGSATPSIETRERAASGRYSVARLSERVTQGGLPDIGIVDLREEELAGGVRTPLAVKTVEAVKATVAAGGQVMVYLNRKGFASFLICAECGEVRGCPNCSISLTMHKRKMQLRCHVCGYKEPVPDCCSVCRGTMLDPVGSGTEALEAELPELVPGLRVLRLDRDQITSATRLEKTLDAFRAGEADVLIGTQMLAKGHDFPNVRLVVVVLADALFRWPDFRAPERACQVLTQVSGRAGRGAERGRVLIQTFNPDHPALAAATGRVSEEAFIEGERELRRELGYPPFGRIARLRIEHPEKNEAVSRSEAIAGVLHAEGIEVLGPSEAFLERARGIYRWDILLKARQIGVIHAAVLRAKDFSRKNGWPLLVDIDPYGVG